MKKRSDLPTEIMTVEQVADYLQLNKLTVYKYLREGRLPASKLGKSYRIRKSDVDWFLDRAKQGPRRPAAAERRGGRPQPARTLVAPARRAEDVYVGPQRRKEPEAHAPSINPMEWVIRGLH